MILGSTRFMKEKSPHTFQKGSHTFPCHSVKSMWLVRLLMLMLTSSPVWERKSRAMLERTGDSRKPHAQKENTHSHPTVAEAELAAVVVVVVKATCEGLETLVTSCCCCWLELEACRLRAPWKEVPLWNALTTSICKEADSVTGRAGKREEREKSRGVRPIVSHTVFITHCKYTHKLGQRPTRTNTELNYSWLTLNYCPVDGEKLPCSSGR